MSWMAVAIGGGAILGYLGNQQTNSANARAARNQGYVDMRTTRAPDPISDPYRQAGLQAAYEALFGRGQTPPGSTAAGRQILTDWQAGGGHVDRGGFEPPNHGVGDARPTTAPGDWTKGDPVPAGYRVNKAGQLVKAKGGGAGGGGGGGGEQPPKFAGQSPETDEIRRRFMADLPDANADLYQAGEDFTTDTLAGDSRNPLLGRATSAADEIAVDPRLEAYQDWLMGGLGIGPKTGGSGPAPSTRDPNDPYAINPGAYTVVSSSGSLGGAQGAGGAAYTSNTGVDAALRKLIAGEAPAGWQGAEDAISRKVNEGRADNIRQLRARAVGSGFYGGDLYKELEEGAIAQGDMELADSLAAARFGAYQEALGLGTQYDLGMADIAARDRATSAGAGAAGADIASRERLAQMGLLGDSLALGEQSRFGRASQLGDLAGLVSSDQGRALDSVNAIGTSRRSDLGAAGDLSLGADANRNNFLAARGNERVGLANVGLGRAELAFDRERFYDPFARLSAYTGVLGGLYGDYGTETASGRDTRSSSPPAYSSPIGGALTGAAIGGSAAGAYQSGKRRPAAGGY